MVLFWLFLGRVPLRTDSQADPPALDPGVLGLKPHRVTMPEVNIHENHKFMILREKRKQTKTLALRYAFETEPDGAH